MLPNLIGIAGGFGAGKDTIANFLIANYGYKGHICVDIPFTQKEQRLAVRAAHHQLTQQAQNEEDGPIDPDLYDDSNEN